MTVCQRCGAANPDGAKFCAECGLSMIAAGPTRQERKVVTVLFADLVGFTSRAERLDPEDVHSLLSRYHTRVRSDIERHGARVEKFIGDAVMALFGAVAAHEDDPERALRAALAIQHWASSQPDLQLRVGITTGEALVSLDARPEAGEGMASGDVINTAARLQAAASPGAILVDEATYRATNRIVAFDPVQSVSAKGKTEPIATWRAREILSRVGVDVRQHGGASLVGRKRELAALVDALERVKERSEPELVTLIGEPGIGKSRLVFELFSEADRQPDFVTWRQGRSLPYGEAVTFWALGEVVKAQAGILETDGVDATAAKLKAAVADLVREPSQGDRIVRYLRPLVGLGGDRDVQDETSQAYGAWRQFLEALASKGPLVVVFEDLHWADDNLLDFLDHLLEWATRAPILVVATARPEFLARRPAWAGGKANATTLSVRSLSDIDTATLVRSLLDQAVVAPDVQASVLARAGGNPLYAEELARMVAERLGRGLGGDSLPESVQGIIAARLDALPTAEKRLLQAASVMGKVFWRSSVAAVGATEADMLDAQLHTLERREFIRREPASTVAGEVEYAFRHALVRDVAYGQIPRAPRAEMHRRAAEWIESLGADRIDDRADLLAHHYANALELATAAGQALGDMRERAVASLTNAAERAVSLQAPTTAARQYARALELLPSDHPDRPGLLFGKADALHRAGDDQARPALEAARDALLKAGDRERAALAESLPGRFAWHLGHAAEAERHQNRALDLLGADRSSPTAIRVLSLSARWAELAGRHDEALRLALEVADAAEQLGLHRVRAHLATTVGMARVHLGDPGGFEDMERGRHVALETGELGDAATASQNLAATLYEAGEAMRGWDLAREARRLAMEGGAMREARFQEEVLTNCPYDVGGWVEAIPVLDRLITQSATSPSSLEGEMRGTRALIRFAQGNVEGALEDIARASHLADSQRDPDSVLLPLGVAARVHVELGRLPEAQKFAERLAPFAHQAAIYNFRDLVFVARQLGIETLVRQVLERHVTWSKLAAAHLAVVDGSFSDAAGMYREMGLRPHEAFARLLAARNLLGAGKAAEALKELRPATEFYRAEKAHRYLEEAEALSRIAGEPLLQHP